MYFINRCLMKAQSHYRYVRKEWQDKTSFCEDKVGKPVQKGMKPKSLQGKEKGNCVMLKISYVAGTNYLL